MLPAYLQRSLPGEVQLEALHAMYNMCRISPARQEAAAVAGIVPLLVKLATPLPPTSTSATQPSIQATGKPVSPKHKASSARHCGIGLALHLDVTVH